MTDTASPARPIGFAEFIALMAALTAMVAMSIDVILPALGAIGQDLAVESPNDRQLAITMFFLGLAVSQIVYGPLSDSFGRRYGIFLGLGIYLVGTALCLISETLPVLVAGRIIQGIGAAGPRIVANAIVRDRYSGRPMARVSSLIMMVFIVVPVFAPLLGQGLLLLMPWRGIFWFLALFTVICFVWCRVRLEETLPEEGRRPFRLGPILQALRVVLGNRLAVGCTLTMGFVFAAFLAFLSASQQILAEAYALGALFPITFSALAVVVGVSSAMNAALVTRFGMQRLSTIGILGIGLSSLGYALWFGVAGMPPLWVAILWLAISVGSIGIIFGNLNAMAMEPLGAVAGVAAGAIGSVSSLMSSILGTAIARSYDGTPLPIALGFLACAILAFVMLTWATRDRVRRVR